MAERLYAAPHPRRAPAARVPCRRSRRVPELREEVLLREDLLLCVAEDHPLASRHRGFVALRDLAEEDWVQPGDEVRTVVLGPPAATGVREVLGALADAAADAASAPGVTVPGG